MIISRFGHICDSGGYTGETVMDILDPSGAYQTIVVFCYFGDLWRLCDSYCYFHFVNF